MKTTKKGLLIITLLTLLTLLIGFSRAVSITVTCTPETVSPGGYVTITVNCDEGASGSVTVTPPPPGLPSTVPITILAGGSASVEYPYDFGSGASTVELGEYTVAVTLSGVEKSYLASFWVFFTVTIPDFPIVGTAGAAVAMLSGLGLHRIRRRRLTASIP